MGVSWISGFSDNDDIFGFYYKCLTYVGMWPQPNWHKRKALLYKCYEVTLTLLSVYYMIVTNIGTFQCSQNVPLFLSCLDKCFAAYNFVSKTMIFLYKRKQIRELLTKMENSGDRVTEERKRIMALQVLLILPATTAIVSAFCGLSFLNSELPIEAWMPFDVHKDTMSLLLGQQIVAVAFVVPCLYRAMVVQGVVSSMIMYICDQLVDVQIRLKQLRYTPKNPVEMKKQLRIIIRKHIRLLSYTTEMNSLFQIFFLIQNLNITIELCLNAINVTMLGFEDKTMSASFISFLFVALLNAFIYCYLGNQLITQSQAIALAAYESSWPSWPLDLQRDILIIIGVSQKPMKLTAGGMSAMSVQTYGHILYNGYSIFAVLNDVVD